MSEGERERVRGREEPTSVSLSRKHIAELARKKGFLERVVLVIRGKKKKKRSSKEEEEESRRRC